MFELIIADDKTIILKDGQLWGCADSEEDAYRIVEELSDESNYIVSRP